MYKFTFSYKHLCLYLNRYTVKVEQKQIFALRLPLWLKTIVNVSSRVAHIPHESYHTWDVCSKCRSLFQQFLDRTKIQNHCPYCCNEHSYFPLTWNKFHEQLCFPLCKHSLVLSSPSLLVKCQFNPLSLLLSWWTAPEKNHTTVLTVFT